MKEYVLADDHGRAAWAPVALAHGVATLGGAASWALWSSKGSNALRVPSLIN